ncbi:MAG: hypothetical protein C5B60_04805 [Chloroflexi bacterium]|nr:MAG: hypothetical protein C5B60_04805 [Chloroflexota bacterium]
MSWQELFNSEPDEVQLPVISEESIDNKTIYPELVKLSLRRRLEILRAIEVPETITVEDLPMIKVVRELCADIMRDAIKIGETVREKDNHHNAIMMAIEAYRARIQEDE